MTFKEGQLTSEQAKVTDTLKSPEPTLNELVPGEYATVDYQAVWYDENDLCWIDTITSTDHTQIDASMVRNYEIRVIRCFEGYVVDVFTPNKKPPSFNRLTTDDLLELEVFDFDFMKPVIAIIGSQTEMDEFAAYYKAQFGNKLPSPQKQRPRDKKGRFIGHTAVGQVLTPTTQD